jgi:hypothetical protein
MELKPNWLYLGFVVTAAGAALGLISTFLTVPVYKAWAAGVAISGGWSWPAVAAVDFGCVLAFASLLLKIRWDTTVVLDDTGLARNSLRGVCRIRWSEVRRIEQVGFGLRVEGHETTSGYHRTRTTTQTLSSYRFWNTRARTTRDFRRCGLTARWSRRVSSLCYCVGRDARLSAHR